MSQNEKKLTVLLFALILLSSLAFKQPKQTKEELKKLEDSQMVMEQKYQDIFGDVSLKAKSAIIYSIKDHKIIFGKMPKYVLPLASITKVMTTIVAMENSSADSVVAIRKEDLEEDSDNGLLVGEKWAQDELVKFMLFNSSNDAASAIAFKVGGEIGGNGLNNKEIFVKKMNEKAKLLGMYNTFFKNETGLDVGILEPGAFGTTADVAKLFDYALSKNKTLFIPTSFSTYVFTSLGGIQHNVANINLFVSSFPHLLASKTGLTESAGGNLAIFFDPQIGDSFVVVVLGSTKEGRFSDAIYLANLASKYTAVFHK